jgi:hypothetical protein
MPAGRASANVGFVYLDDAHISAAKALNLTIPDKLLGVADEVITHGKSRNAASLMKWWRDKSYVVDGGVGCVVL